MRGCLFQSESTKKISENLCRELKSTELASQYSGRDVIIMICSIEWVSVPEGRESRHPVPLKHRSSVPADSSFEPD